MKIMVCIKQVPHQDARLDVRGDGTWIQEENIKFEINPYDQNALEALVRTYAAEVKHSRIRVNLIDPGPTRTGMRAAAMPGEDPMTLPTAESLAPKMLEMLSADFDRTAVLWDRRKGQYVEFG